MVDFTFIWGHDLYKIMGMLQMKEENKYMHNITPGIITDGNSQAPKFFTQKRWRRRCFSDLHIQSSASGVFLYLVVLLDTLCSLQIKMFQTLFWSKHIEVWSWVWRMTCINESGFSTTTVILHCLTLYYVILHRVTLYRVILHRVTLYYTVLPCVTLYYTVLHCITLCYIVLHRVTLYYIVLHCIALYYTVLPCVTLYYIPLHVSSHWLIDVCLILHSKWKSSYNGCIVQSIVQKKSIYCWVFYKINQVA